MSGSSASGALIGACLATLADYADSMSVAEMDALAGGTISLIASALRPILEPQRKSGGHVLASFANVRRFIDTNPASPALETDKLAGNFGLSRASLYRLFALVGGVAAYIRRERLRHVFRDISAAEHANVRFAGLARRWGFKDTSTFNRAFRQTFGISPGEARAAAAPLVVVSNRPPMLYDPELDNAPLTSDYVIVYILQRIFSACVRHWPEIWRGVYVSSSDNCPDLCCNGRLAVAAISGTNVPRRCQGHARFHLPIE